MNKIARLQLGMVVREIPSGQDVRLFYGPHFVDAGFRERESVVEGGQSLALQVEVQQLLEHCRRGDEMVIARQRSSDELARLPT